MHRAINAFVKEYYYGKEAHAARELQRDERRRNDLYQRRRRFYRSVCNAGLGYRYPALVGVFVVALGWICVTWYIRRERKQLKNEITDTIVT